MKGVVTGCVIGAAAAVLFGMMNRQTQKRMMKAATQAGSRVADKASEFFGK